MISKKKLTQRVNARKKQMTSDKERLDRMTGKVVAFISDIKERTVIYNLLKNLTVWKEIEELIINM